MLGRCSPRRPALPLDEAGKYVAGAYIVFVVLLVVYVAIMAAKLQRIERELRELAELRRAAQGRGGRAEREEVERLMASCSPSASPTRPRRWTCASGSR